MGLNIKTEEAHQLAKKLAKKTGESMTEAVTKALRERFARFDTSRRERLQAIIDDMSKRLNKPGRKMMEIEDLYDEKTGLPK